MAKMTLPSAFVFVTNDLTTDQRVDRTCQTLAKMGYAVTLVGRQLPESLPLASRSYSMRRIRLWFRKGPFFYGHYNIRIFFLILFQQMDLIVSNDLDTLAGCFLAWRLKSRRRKVQLLHDCHEYFRGVPELTGRPGTLRIWKFIEDAIFPRLPLVIAVNDSIADIYRKEYGNHVEVVRNVPFRKAAGEPVAREKLGIKPDEAVILYQGAVNVDRGLEEAILAMKYIRTPARLVIIGTGDVVTGLKQLASRENLMQKVVFAGQIPFQELAAYTRLADIGLSIEKDVSLNYHYCLPNKFLDYIQAQVPVLVSPFPEMKAILDKYQIGHALESHDPRRLAAQIDRMLDHPDELARYRSNLIRAATDLCWENEEQKLKSLLSPEKDPNLQCLHIISFDIPYPPTYGGVIDVFFKLKALRAAGWETILHCFEYQRPRSPELDSLCSHVYYYPRHTGWRAQFSLRPYIVSSRTSSILRKRLMADNYPILFEGLHTCGLLNDPVFRHRIKVYRESNIEHHYYRHLFRASRHPIHKLFYLAESVKLRFFQHILKHASVMLVVSREDMNYLQSIFPASGIVYLPSFHHNERVVSLPGRGEYVLYQGNLGVEENEQAACYIVSSIWTDTMPPLVIAGMNPSGKLTRLASGSSNITLIANPDEEKMRNLIRNAQINLMLTFQPTGLKLKLLHALFEGRFCLVNPEMLAGTGLESLCRIAGSIGEFREIIPGLMKIDFTEEEIVNRQQILDVSYSNKKNCQILTDIVSLLSTNHLSPT